MQPKANQNQTIIFKQMVKHATNKLHLLLFLYKDYTNISFKKNVRMQFDSKSASQFDFDKKLLCIN